MQSATHHRAPFSRIRFVHVIAPIAISVGLVIGGYSVLTDLADDIASTVKPIQSDATPALAPVTTPVAGTTIAAN